MRKVRRNNRFGVSGVGVYGEGNQRFWLARIDYHETAIRRPRPGDFVWFNTVRNKPKPWQLRM